MRASRVSASQTRSRTATERAAETWSEATGTPKNAGGRITDPLTPPVSGSSILKQVFEDRLRRERRDGEVEAAQPQRRQADQRADGRGRRARAEQGEDAVHPGVAQVARRVSADPQQRALREGNLPAQADEQVER